MVEVKKDMLFWNGIMSDHGKFLINSLTGKEKDMVDLVTKYHFTFQKMNEELLNPKVDIKLKIKETKDLVSDFVQLKKSLLSRLLSCDIELTMTPTFLNDMINEAMEYYLILCLANDNIKFNPLLELIRIHKIWLFDAAGHAYFIASQLDGIETLFIKKSLDFYQDFNSLYLESTQLALLYERTLLTNGKIDHFNQTVISLMHSFISFLKNLKDLKSECKVLTTGTFSPLVLDHMIREEEYYLAKIAYLNALR